MTSTPQPSASVDEAFKIACEFVPLKFDHDYEKRRELRDAISALVSARVEELAARNEELIDAVLEIGGGELEQEDYLTRAEIDDSNKRAELSQARTRADAKETGT